MALIDIGSTKQLFVDAYLIESLQNARRVLNPAEKAENNPVIRPDRPWEGNYLAPCNAFYDVREQTFKLWYSSATYKAYRKPSGELDYGPHDDDSQQHPGVVCLAVSRDGIQWEKPDLGLVEFQGSKRNNILPEESFLPYFFQDLHEQHPAKRYKGLVRKGTYGGKGMQFDLFFSPDAFHWTPYERNPVIETTGLGRWGPTVFHGWDSLRKVYYAHMENCAHRHCPLKKRLIGRAESPDMLRWSEPETIILPDAGDPPDLEFYYMASLIYEGLYVGLLCDFRTNRAAHHVEIAFSRDGAHYERGHREEAFVPRGPRGSFDASSLYPLDPIVHGGRILTYYLGVNWRSIETLFELGEKALGAVGLAVTPLDGFVSVEGGRLNPGELVTRSFGFTGRRLEVNAQPQLSDDGKQRCDLRVEILSGNHEPIPGFSVQEADPVTDASPAAVISWKGKCDLGELAGRTIRLRFLIKNARLCSFRFVD
ncbi:MAG: hypothetical protein HYU36_02405 [Planctomycetes bacterium]|nr:hypothetical protein [Planctomycetota bacterium]